MKVLHVWNGTKVSNSLLNVNFWGSYPFRSGKLWDGTSMDWICWSSTSYRCSIRFWGIWSPKQHLELVVMFLKPFRNSFCSVAGALCWKRALSSGNTTAMKWCTWSATMFRLVVRVKVTFSWMPGPKVSQQNIAQSIRLPSPTCFSSHSASCCHVFLRQAPQTLPAILLI